MATSADLAVILRDALRGEGEGLLDDRLRLGAALRERLPGEARAIHLLLTALDAGIPARLRSGDGQAPDGEIGQEASQLVDHFGVAQDFAREAVETWAMALGRLPGLGEMGVSTPDVRVTEQRHAEEPAQQASRSTQDGASFETRPPAAPQDDAVVEHLTQPPPPLDLPGLPPLPTGGAGHQDSVLATPGSGSESAQADPDLRPILPRPPDLPVPSPASTGPVPRDAETSGGTASPELPPVHSLPPVQPFPPIQPLPPVQTLPEVRPLPATASEPKPLPEVKPLPSVQPLPPVRSLASAAPPVQPLPSAAPPVQPLPGIRPIPPSGSILPPVQPIAGGQPPSPPAGRPLGIAGVAAIVGIVAVGFGVWEFFGGGDNAPAKPPEPPPRIGGRPTERPAERPATAGGQTAEGFPIVDAQTEPNVAARPLEGNPNTLLFAFGLRFGQETYTYQAAVDFTRGDANGAGLVKVFKGGRESATDQLRTSRSIQSNGYLGFTMSGPMRGAVSAPDVCVSALVGKTSGRFDLANGGGLFCAFATKPGGVCDGDVKIGCGKLVP